MTELFVLGWIAGNLGFLYWWTRDHEMTLPIMVVGIFLGLFLGPLTWIIGWYTAGRRRP